MYTPASKRIDFVRNAEMFHDEIEPGKNYPIDFVVYRLTGRRVPTSEHVTLVGEAIAPDLRLLIDALSRSVEMPIEADDPCETTAELAARLEVSTKTIARWRKEGLRWRWGNQEQGGKVNVLIPQSAVEAFEARKDGRVKAASRFSRLTIHEKRRLVARARRLAKAVDVPAQAICKHLAKRTGRSIEAIRKLLSQHDAAEPDNPVFIDRSDPLTAKQKELIDRAYHRGVTVTALCDRLGKTRSTIYRAIYEARARRATMIKIELVRLPIFDREDADEVILRTTRRGGKTRRLDHSVIESLPEELQPIYDRPIDSDRTTKSLLVKYNFLKHRASELQAVLRDSAPRATDLDLFDGLLENARTACGEAIAGTLPIVLSVVRRQLTGGEQTDRHELFKSLDIANAVLIEEIRRFDPVKSHTFESVLTNRLLRVLANPDTKHDPVDADRLYDRLAVEGFRIRDEED